MTEARDFNTRHEIHGVLYYADDYFFQCLEGEEKHILMLLEKLKKDPRHDEIILLKTGALKETNFSHWSMKYVGQNRKIQNHFKSLGHHHFAPNQLNEQSLDALLSFLYDVQPSMA